ncbi:MAG: HEAT repeat domain-containing protein [Woeseia sp.]
MNSSLSENAAVLAALAAAAVTLLLFSVALVLRTVHVLHDRRTRRLRATWWPIFAETAASERFAVDAPLPKVCFGQKRLLLREWSRFRNLVLGQAAVSLNTLATRLDLLPLARRHMKRRLLNRRLLGLQVVGQMRDRDSWDAIDRVLEDPNIALSVTAATALVNIHADRAIPRIVPLIGRFSRWPRTQIGRILSRAGPDIVSRPLCREIADAPTEAAVLLLQFADSAYPDDINAVAESLLKSRSEPAVLSAALKAARGGICPERVRALTGHETWYVRMQAASLIGRMGKDKDVSSLEPLLSDSEWWVRYRAAQALAASPFLGPNSLRRIAARQEDRFAHDILQQALAEKGLA